MHRYCLEVCIDNTLIYFEEFSSITQVAICCDRFKSYPGICFDLYDVVKGRSINVNELMRCWHA